MRTGLLSKHALGQELKSMFSALFGSTEDCQSREWAKFMYAFPALNVSNCTSNGQYKTLLCIMLAYPDRHVDFYRIVLDLADTFFCSGVMDCFKDMTDTTCYQIAFFVSVQCRSSPPKTEQDVSFLCETISQLGTLS